MFFLKIIAILSMLIDHSNKIIFDSAYPFMLEIGRLAFPLFCYIAVYNYIHFTKNKELYISRCFIFGIVSAPFYYFAFGVVLPINILFTLSLGLSLLYSIERDDTFLTILILLFSLFVDYGVFAMYLFYSCYLYIKKYTKFNVIFFVFSLFLVNSFEFFYYVPLFFLLLLLAQKVDFSVKINKYFYYAFYPMHLIILKLISLL